MEKYVYIVIVDDVVNCEREFGANVFENETDAKEEMIKLKNDYMRYCNETWIFKENENQICWFEDCNFAENHYEISLLKRKLK